MNAATIQAGQRGATDVAFDFTAAQFPNAIGILAIAWVESPERAAQIAAAFPALAQVRVGMAYGENHEHRGSVEFCISGGATYKPGVMRPTALRRLRAFLRTCDRHGWAIRQGGNGAQVITLDLDAYR